MEVATLDVEDDVYFADLSKQISLLIMDEDEHLPVTQWHSAPLQVPFFNFPSLTAILMLSASS